MKRCKAQATAVLIAALSNTALGCGVPVRQPIRPNCLAECDNACQNWVLVEFDISPSGRVESPEIVEACPNNNFNYTALESIRQWRYKPSADGKQDARVILRK